MKKRIPYIITLLILTSCNSSKITQRSINTGNYDNAIAVSIKKLKSNKTKKSNQQYVYMLEEAFDKASKRDLEKINFLNKESKPENLESIYNIYVSLNRRQERIKPLLPLPVFDSGTNATFNFKDFSNEIIASKDKLSEYLYDNAILQVNSNNKKELRNAYQEFEYIEEINPNYKDTRNFMDEVHSRGTDYVLVSLENKTDKIVPIRLEEDLLNFDTYGLNDFWTVYHSTIDTTFQYDFGLELDLTNIEVSPERINEKEIVKEKVVKDGFTYVVDGNGNKVKDSLGNTIKIDKMITVRSKLYEFTQYKTAFVSGQVKYVDYNTNQLIQTFPIQSEFVFEHNYATFRGDRRALGKKYSNLIKKEALLFPSNEQMIYDTGSDLKQKLKHIITRNGFRK